MQMALALTLEDCLTLRRSLYDSGYARVTLQAAAAARAALPSVAAKLNASFQQGQADWHATACVSIATYPERVQLRYVPASGKLTELELVADAAFSALQQVALQTLVSLKVDGAPQDGESLLDAFWYPGTDGWGSRPGQPPPPCPAHADVGLVTFIVDSHPALEVQRADGSWLQVAPLKHDECLVIAGRALATLTRGRVPACVHRVRHTEQPRTSLVFEVRLDERGARIQARLEAETAARAMARGADDKYAMAAAALLTPQRGAGLACVVM